MSAGVQWPRGAFPGASTEKRFSNYGGNQESPGLGSQGLPRVLSQSSCKKAGAEREFLPLTPAWRGFIRQLISRKAKGFRERSKSYIGFTLGFCAKEFHLVTKKKLLPIIRETFQGQKMQLGKHNPPLHVGGCQAVLYKGFVFVVLRQVWI